MKFSFLPKKLAKYQWNSIFVKYMAILLVTFLIMFTITTTVILYNVNTTLAHNNDRLFDKITLQAENSINSIENTISVGISSVSSYQYLPLILNSYLDDNPYFTDAFRTISSLLNYMHIDSDYISSVYIYSAKSDYVYSLLDSPVSSNTIKYFADPKIINHYRQNEETPVFRKASIDGTEYTYLSFIQNIKNGSSSSGYIIYNVNLPNLFKVFNCSAHLVNSENEILYSTSGTVFNSTEAILNAKSSEIHKIDFAGEKFAIILENPQTRIFVSPWIYPLLISLVIIVSLALAYFIAYALYKYIDKICELVQSPFATTDSKKGNNAEYKFITTKLRDLVLTNNNSNNELTQKLMQLNDIQATALQLQVSPHFLYNTLNLISSISLAESKKDTKITIVVDLLSKMLNTILDTSNLVCNLETEITYTKQYIEIQKYKYEDFEIVWDINEKDYNIPIVKFTMQPIIENAIHHGISNLESGVITISGNKVGRTYEIIISDNGDGISKEREAQINSVIDSEHNPGTSIGLWNTNKRLKILLGDEYGCKIKSLKKGTAVIITLPLNK